MKFAYPAVLVKGEGKSYGVIFPDIACWPSGETEDEAIADARSALADHITVSLEEDLELADPTPLDRVDISKYERPLRLFMVEVDVRAKAERINITMDKALLAAVDKVAKNRSRFIADAVRSVLKES